VRAASLGERHHFGSVTPFAVTQYGVLVAETGFSTTNVAEACLLAKGSSMGTPAGR
jgi:hypothetical protein